MPQISPGLLLALIFAALLVVNALLKNYLNQRQMRHVWRNRLEVPSGFREHIDADKHLKAAQYTVDHLQFESWQTVLTCAVVLAWTLLGGLQLLINSVYALFNPNDYPLLSQWLIGIGFGVIGALIDLPLSWYRSFGLEAKHGFNRTTPKLFVFDQLKTALLSIGIGGPVLALVLLAMHYSPQSWWWQAWLIWVGFTLLMLLVYPLWIAPWFNRFSALPDGPLRQQIENLMQRCGLRSQGVYVVDGSTRSSRANAYFTGVGAAKRVVFYDTLLNKLSNEETLAVMAHELGHHQLQHVRWRIASVLAASLALLAILGWLALQPWFFTGLGVWPSLSGHNQAATLLLFVLVLPEFLFLLSPLNAWQSRRHEFQADAYACQHAKAHDLRTALLKLYRDNASTLTPDSLYARFYYSHPPATERLAALPDQTHITLGQST